MGNGLFVEPLVIVGLTRLDGLGLSSQSPSFGFLCISINLSKNFQRFGWIFKIDLHLCFDPALLDFLGHLGSAESGLIENRNGYQ